MLILTIFFLKLINIDIQIRGPAEAYLVEYEQSRYDDFLKALCIEFAAETNPPDTRQLAGLYIKNMITGYSKEVRLEKEQKWVNAPSDIKDEARTAFMQALGSQIRTVSHTAAQVLAAYGAVDIPLGEFSTLVENLRTYVSMDEVPVQCKVSCLECLGYLCETLYSSDNEDALPRDVTNKILDAIITGNNESNPIEMRKAATNALYNTLPFASGSFEEPSAAERDMILKSLCSSMVCKGEDFQPIRQAAYQCLEVITENYYEFLGPYIEHIYHISVDAIANDEEEVSAQAIQFWNSVCLEEITRNDDLENGIKETKHLRIMKTAAAGLIGLILQGSIKESDADADEEASCKVDRAQAFLDNMSECIGDEIVPLVLPFITANIRSEQWNLREAAVNAFGFILYGPKEATIQPVITEAFTILQATTADPNEAVARAAMWTIGRICSYHSAIIQPMITQLWQTIDATLSKVPPNAKTQSMACTALYHIAISCEEHADADTNMLSQFMRPAIMKILNKDVNHALVSGEENITDSYEAVNMMVMNSAKDQIPFVKMILTEALTRLEATFTSDDPQARMALQGHLSALVGVCIQKMPVTELDEQLCDRIMTCLLNVVSDVNSSALQDSYMAMGFLIDKLESQFEKYSVHVLTALFGALQKFDDHATCVTVITVFGDVCRAMGEKINGATCDALVTAILKLLSSDEVEKIIKPPAIALFSDIALAIGEHFEKYSNVVVQILIKAGKSVVLTNEDEDYDEFVMNMRDSILEAFIGIVQGLKDKNRQDVISPYQGDMLDFLILCGKDSIDNEDHSSVLKNAIGLCGDLVQAFEAKIVPKIANSECSNLVAAGAQHEDTDIKEVSNWVKTLVLQFQG